LVMLDAFRRAQTRIGESGAVAERSRANIVALAMDSGKIARTLGSASLVSPRIKTLIFFLRKIFFSDLCQYGSVWNWASGRKHTQMLARFLPRMHEATRKKKRNLFPLFREHFGISKSEQGQKAERQRREKERECLEHVTKGYVTQAATARKHHTDTHTHTHTHTLSLSLLLSLSFVENADETLAEVLYFCEGTEL
jgi:hypothetical protein